jgi:hypothetical protein
VEYDLLHKVVRYDEKLSGCHGPVTLLRSGTHSAALPRGHAPAKVHELVELPIIVRKLEQHRDNAGTVTIVGPTRKSLSTFISKLKPIFCSDFDILRKTAIYLPRKSNGDVWVPG